VRHGSCCGWDIGGAHLKMVSVSGTDRVNEALQLAAPIWQGLDHLRTALKEALRRLPAGRHRHAVTMTAELADCFPDRVTGVRAVLEAATEFLGTEIVVYSADGFYDPVAARGIPGRIASVNWHASAELVGHWYGQAVLIDIGSTTTDLIAIRAGEPAVRGYTDRERLQYDELVYTGVVRTPIMAVAQRAPIGGTEQHLAAEQFATMADVYRLTGDLPDGADIMPTADGGPRDIEGSARRLARMACADFNPVQLDDWRALARWLRGRQVALLQEAVHHVIGHAGLQENAPVVGAGCGRFLAARLAEALGRPYIDAADKIDAEQDLQSKAADMLPAYSLALLLCRQPLPE